MPTIVFWYLFGLFPLIQIKPKYTILHNPTINRLDFLTILKSSVD